MLPQISPETMAGNLIALSQLSGVSPCTWRTGGWKEGRAHLILMKNDVSLAFRASTGLLLYVNRNAMPEDLKIGHAESI